MTNCYSSSYYYYCLLLTILITILSNNYVIQAQNPCPNEESYVGYGFDAACQSRTSLKSCVMGQMYNLNGQLSTVSTTSTMFSGLFRTTVHDMRTDRANFFFEDLADVFSGAFNTYAQETYTSDQFGYFAFRLDRYLLQPILLDVRKYDMVSGAEVLFQAMMSNPKDSTLFDSFVRQYGTHVITRATMGGYLSAEAVASTCSTLVSETSFSADFENFIFGFSSSNSYTQDSLQSFNAVSAPTYQDAASISDWMSRVNSEQCLVANKFQITLWSDLYTTLPIRDSLDAAIKRRMNLSDASTPARASCPSPSPSPSSNNDSCVFMVNNKSVLDFDNVSKKCHLYEGNLCEYENVVVTPNHLIYFDHGAQRCDQVGKMIENSQQVTVCAINTGLKQLNDQGEGKVYGYSKYPWVSSVMNWITGLNW